ncbi:MAG: winged helix DNA-binding domain-containing protein [Acidimicrobiia bacterium]
MPISRRQLNRATLARQSLLCRESGTAVEAVRSAVALQAQEPASPYLALWNRVEGFDAADLDNAFATQSVVKASLMRITLHAVAGEEYTTFHEAMVRNLRASRLNDRRFTSTGYSTPDADALVPWLLRQLTTPRTGPEIEAALAERLGRDPERLWWAIRTFAPIAHAATGGPWSFARRPSYRPAPREPARGSAHVALQQLILRYLEGFGPASAQDFGQFALQRQAEIKPAIEALSDELVRLEGPEGQTMWDMRGGAIPHGDVEAPPRLLGMWDSILLAYADRSRVIPEAYRSTVIRRNGDVLPTLLVDGHVAGVWRPIEGGIEARAFHALTPHHWEGLAAEASALLAFLADRDPTVYGRYGRWWDFIDAAETRLLAD